ncbi:hypothetical protein N7455_003682 [Penicillium solitum]|uniref:uncharacterized protein n=1 Tax=Penicillium solitum TaxID=60172 RepID=UPI0032C3E8A3|nr:hypothetical protein N7455_003682 [Penicillium solitum]
MPENMPTHPVITATGVKQPLTLVQIPTPQPKQHEVQVPPGLSLAAAATLPTNVITAFLTISDKLGFELPWPRPSGFSSKDQNIPILIWGAASSVGQFAVQILKYWGYTNIIATASPRHHSKIKGYNAKHFIDYKDPDAVTSILNILSTESPSIPLRVFDRVDSKFGSLQHIAKIATPPGSIVAAVLPVVVRSPSEKGGVQVSLDVTVTGEASWMPGVETHGIVSYAFEANPFLKYHILPDIIPGLIALSAIEPNKYREIEGDSLLERATTALDTLRSGQVSGERLVWKVWTESEFPQFKGYKEAFGLHMDYYLTQHHKHPILTGLDSHLRNLSNYHGPYCHSVMIKGMLDYINGRVVEHRIKQSNFKFSSESRLMPMCLRTKVGGAEIMIHFLYPNSVFPEEEYVMQYFPITLELVLFIDFTNDILSYYKEFCLNDETGNFVANFADAHHVQHLDVLRYLTSYTPAVTKSAYEQLRDSSSLLALVRNFTQGMIMLFTAHRRYHLVELFADEQYLPPYNEDA